MSEGMGDLATVRRELAAAQSNLRHAQDMFNLARTNAELGLYELHGGDAKAIGSNEYDRKRAYDVACESDQDFTYRRTAFRKAQDQVGKLEAELHIHMDARKERELAIAERNIELVTGVTFKTEAIA